jgi:hypothetical protein
MLLTSPRSPRTRSTDAKPSGWALHAATAARLSSDVARHSINAAEREYGGLIGNDKP